MTKVDIQEVANAHKAYYKTNREQRLGQYLMNTLLPSESNSHVFYEKDDDLAFKLFVNTYCGFSSDCM